METVAWYVRVTTVQVVDQCFMKTISKLLRMGGDIRKPVVLELNA
jgi:hypothetical protein